MTIAMEGKYQTRDGRAVRILCVDGNEKPWPVVGYIGGRLTVDSWDTNGYFAAGRESSSDLIPVPTKHEGWCLVDTLAPTYPTRARAERAFDEGNYAVTPIGNPRYRIAFYTWEN